MEFDDFEQKLQHQTIREVPHSWRREILAAAHSARAPHLAVDRRHAGWFSSFPRGLSALLWPSPKAWCGLAALWVLIVAFHFATPNSSPVLAENPVAMSPQRQMALRDQEKLLAELIGRSAKRESDSKLSPSRPRSQGEESIL